MVDINSPEINSQNTKLLFAHQSAAVRFILANGGCGGLAHDIGCGKTRTALEIYAALRLSDPTLRLLVICPISLINAAWGEDIKRWTNFSYVNMRKPENITPDIYIINYEAFLSENRIEQIKFLLRSFDFMCVLDESSKIKNHSAATSKSILSLRDLFKYRLVMSGTMAPNDETEYWPQVKFIRPGIVHEKFFPFRNYYFHLQRERGSRVEYSAGGFTSKAAARDMYSKGWHYAMTDVKRAELINRISQVVHFARKADCLDLPEQMDEMRSVELTGKQRSLYTTMENELVIELGNEMIAAPVALAKMLKLREICSGFAIQEDGKNIAIGEDPKLRELQNVLEEAGGSNGKNQAIIWANFRHEIRTIAAAIKDCVILDGETKDRDAVIEAFRSGKTRYLIAHPRSAGHGLTLVNCSVQVFYSLDYSYEYHEQCRGRTHRPGQVNKCTYIYLICRDTIEEDIWEVLREKKEAVEVVDRWMKRKRIHQEVIT